MIREHHFGGSDLSLGVVNVNTYSDGDQGRRIDATATQDGGFIVTWDSFGGDGANWGVSARKYSSSGVAEQMSLLSMI